MGGEQRGEADALGERGAKKKALKCSAARRSRVGQLARPTRWSTTRRESSGTLPLAERALVEQLGPTAELIRQVAAQTAERMAGGMPAGSRRTVSLHDPHARVIVKGRLGKPVEFGYKAQLVDNEER